ncbi:hypothetical protein Esti_004863 [Eimeria stiedai]
MTGRGARLAVSTEDVVGGPEPTFTKQLHHESDFYVLPRRTAISLSVLVLAIVMFVTLRCFSQLKARHWTSASRTLAEGGPRDGASGDCSDSDNIGPPAAAGASGSTSGSSRPALPFLASSNLGDMELEVSEEATEKWHRKHPMLASLSEQLGSRKLLYPFEQVQHPHVRKHLNNVLCFIRSLRHPHFGTSHKTFSFMFEGAAVEISVTEVLRSLGWPTKAAVYNMGCDLQTQFLTLMESISAPNAPRSESRALQFESRREGGRAVGGCILVHIEGPSFAFPFVLQKVSSRKIFGLSLLEILEITYFQGSMFFTLLHGVILHATSQLSSHLTFVGRDRNAA